MSSSISPDLFDQLALADSLRKGRDTMLTPQDLPGRYGRVIAALDRVLSATETSAVVAGGWAVWRHGYVGRVTQDVDVVVPRERVDELLQVAAVSGFDVLPIVAGRWPKLVHRDTGVQVDLLPEGQRPGTTARPAPTTIAHPGTMGAAGVQLQYVALPALVELKLAAGRARDEADVVELIRQNPTALREIAEHLGRVHHEYAAEFQRLVERAKDEDA